MLTSTLTPPLTAPNAVAASTTTVPMGGGMGRGEAGYASFVGVVSVVVTLIGVRSDSGRFVQVKIDMMQL